MKISKQIFIIFLLVFGITLVGCQTTLGVAEEVVTIYDYFPFLENTLLSYRGEGNEYAEQSVYFEFIEGNKTQLKVMNPGTNIIKIIENKEGVLSEIYLEGEFYHIENMLNVKPQKENIILKEPLVVGNLWYTKDGVEKEITGIDTIIETPFKSFEALEVTTVFDEGRNQKDYFAKGIGLVASIYTDGENQVKTLLKDIKNQPLEHEALIYYPLKDDGKTVFVDDKIDFYTNQSIERLIESKLKEIPSEDLSAPLFSDVIINSIHLDRSSWTVRVDFSKEMLTNMTVGSSLENEIIKSIVNTLGKFYDTEKVYISVAGNPYESGHFAIREGEYFKVDMIGIEEFSK